MEYICGFYAVNKKHCMNGDHCIVCNYKGDNMPTGIRNEDVPKRNLLEYIGSCRAHNEDMRFGQLLFNAFALHDGRGITYDEDFHQRLFYAEDSEIVTILKEWFEYVEQQRNKKD